MSVSFVCQVYAINHSTYTSTATASVGVKVCVRSVCVQKLELTNHLSVYVWVQLEMDRPELQGSSPLSHVLPPRSCNTLPLTFHSNELGHFYRLEEEAAQTSVHLSPRGCVERLERQRGAGWTDI